MCLYVFTFFQYSRNIDSLTYFPTGTIEIPVLRQGSDLSSVTSVWCATRPAEQDSATPGVDYIPSSKKVEFRPGKTEEVIKLDCSYMCSDICKTIGVYRPHAYSLLDM